MDGSSCLNATHWQPVAGFWCICAVKGAERGCSEELELPVEPPSRRCCVRDRQVVEPPPLRPETDSWFLTTAISQTGCRSNGSRWCGGSLRHRQGICVVHHQGTKPADPHAIGHVDDRMLGQWEFAQRVLDGDFPGAYGRQVALRRRIGQVLKQPRATVPDPFAAKASNECRAAHARPGPPSATLEVAKDRLFKRVVEIRRDVEATRVSQDRRCFEPATGARRRPECGRGRGGPTGPRVPSATLQVRHVAEEAHHPAAFVVTVEQAQARVADVEPARCVRRNA